MSVSRTLYRVIIVDKQADKVIFDGLEIANDSSVALAQAVVNNAKEIAGKDVHTYSSSITSYSVEK